MLSIFDLLAAGTVELDLAAELMARVSRGASLMVGARPGGAGKTTVMCSLLNLCPAELPLAAATPEAIAAAADADAPQRCYVCHEIGAGPYFAYLWGDALRGWCALARRGHVLATNLHADDLDEARRQVCGDNAVPGELFNRFDLLVFLRVIGGGSNGRRQVARVHAADGSGAGRGHRAIFDLDAGGRIRRRDRPPNDYTQECRVFLEGQWRAGTRTIEQTRRAVVEFLAAHRPA